MQYQQAPAPARDSAQFDVYMRKIVMWGCDWQYARTTNSAYKQKGGWEGWAQVEIAFMFSNLPDAADSFKRDLYGASCESNDLGLLAVSREQPVYRNKPRDKADILMWHPPAHYIGNTYSNNFPMTYPVVMIELKCESFNNQQKFKSNVTSDLKKMNDADPVHRPCWIYCVALSMTTEGDEAMRELQMNREMRPMDFGVFLDCAFNVFWQKKYFP